MENGVDSCEYAARRESASVPEDMNNIRRPRLGYSGLIGKRLNLKLLECLACSHRNWSIVLVGKVDNRECEDQIAALRRLPNVYFLGEKNPKQVASYICAFDVGLLPYAINVETRHISPIKMYEYWAAGKPVISTAIPAACRNSNAVNIAHDIGAFVKKSEEVLERSDTVDSQFLIELAEKNTWDARVDLITSELLARIGADRGLAAQGDHANPVSVADSTSNTSAAD
jgi:glycosyltransferase involved in cell wall biosynthesis